MTKARLLMSEKPYVIFPWDEIRAYVATHCPTGNLSEMLPKLEADSLRIKELPLEAAERQLLALLRLRASCLPSDWYGAPSRVNDLRYWCMLQRSCPLAA